MIKWLSLLMVLSMLTVGQTLYKSDVENDDFRDIHNFTSKIVWNYSYDYDYEAVGVGRLTNIVSKFVDVGGFVGFESVKMGVEYGYENPQYDFKFFMKIIIWIIILSLVTVLLSQIVPIIAIIYLLFYYIGLFIKKVVKSIKTIMRLSKY